MSGHVGCKSKHRVSAYGEVFTHSREIKGMLNLVQSESNRIDSRFLEPGMRYGQFSFGDFAQ